MQQNQPVDMSQYRQQQQLLQQPVHNLLPQHLQSQQQTLTTQLNKNINDINLQNHNSFSHESDIQEGSQNNNDLNINLSQNQVGHRNQSNQYRVVKIVLDSCIFAYLIARFFFIHKLPLFANIFLAQYIYHNWRVKYQKQIDRSLITAMSLWPIFKFLYYGFSSIYQEEMVFVMLYCIQLIPNLCGLALTCCIVSCTCFCTTCCFCCCALDEIRKSIVHCIERYKYRKIKEQIYSHNIENIQGVQCSICLQEGNKMVPLKCSHLFHPQCLKTWIDQHRTCPNCRATLY